MLKISNQLTQLSLSSIKEIDSPQKNFHLVEASYLESKTIERVYMAENQDISLSAPSMDRQHQLNTNMGPPYQSVPQLPTSNDRNEQYFFSKKSTLPKLCPERRKKMLQISKHFISRSPVLEYQFPVQTKNKLKQMKISSNPEVDVANISKLPSLFLKIYEDPISIIHDEYSEKQSTRSINQFNQALQLNLNDQIDWRADQQVSMQEQSKCLVKYSDLATESADQQNTQQHYEDEKYSYCHFRRMTPTKKSTNCQQYPNSTSWSSLGKGARNPL